MPHHCELPTHQSLVQVFVMFICICLCASLLFSPSLIHSCAFITHACVLECASHMSLMYLCSCARALSPSLSPSLDRFPRTTRTFANATCLIADILRQISLRLSDRRLSCASSHFFVSYPALLATLSRHPHAVSITRGTF